MLTNLPGPVSLALVIIYILVQHVIVPLVRRRNNRQRTESASNNPHSTGSSDVSARLSALSDEVKGHLGESRARWEAQQEVNKRLEANDRRVFERLDDLSNQR